MIELYDGYCIVVDNYNYSVAKKTTPKKGEAGYKFISHNSSLSGALNSFRRLVIKEKLKNGSRTLLEALNAIREIDEAFEKFIEENIPQT